VSGINGRLVNRNAPSVFERYRVWTLVTSPLLEIDFFALILGMFMLWAFVPTLERFWGTTRFYRFVVITSIAGTLAGTLVGLATGRDVAISGLSPFIWASVVAFGIVYAKQPVQFFGVLPLSGRQLMYGFIGFLILFIGLQGLWEKGASFDATGDLLLRMTRGGHMSIWDRATGENLVSAFDLLRNLANARFLPDGRIEATARNPGLLDLPRETRPIAELIREIDCRVPLQVTGSRLEPATPACP